MYHFRVMRQTRGFNVSRAVWFGQSGDVNRSYYVNDGTKREREKEGGREGGDRRRQREKGRKRDRDTENG
jgi:hypothetical protein